MSFSKQPPRSKKVYWDDQLKRRVEEIKSVVCKLVEQGLRYYDKRRPTILMTDWSKAGMGFAVLQQWCDRSTPDFPRGQLAVLTAGNLPSAAAGF